MPIYVSFRKIAVGAALPLAFRALVEDMPRVEVVAPKKRKGPPVKGKKGKIQRW